MSIALYSFLPKMEGYTGVFKICIMPRRTIVPKRIYVQSSFFKLTFIPTKLFRTLSDSCQVTIVTGFHIYYI